METMQLTYSAKLDVDEHIAGVLSAQACRYGQLKRILYQTVAREGGSCKDHKTVFCHKHRITARQFNGLAIDLQGGIDSVRELLKVEVASKAKKLKSLKAKLKRAKAIRKGVDAGRLRLSTKVNSNNLKTLHFTPLKITQTENELAKLKARLKANVPGMCFGSRKLFNAQFHLEQSGFASHEEWKERWRASRSHQFFFVGSKDETGGNQSCVLTLIRSALGAKGKAQFSARIRTFDEIQDKEKYLTVSFEMGHGSAQVMAALARHQALTFRFHQDVESLQWYVHISFDVPDAVRVTSEKQYGVLGVDFNEDHLAMTETDAHGNLLRTFRVNFDIEGKTSEQRADALSLALDEVLAHAVKHKLPVAMESLDFSAKKQSMTRMSVKRRVKLSGLMYAAYQKFMTSKCARKGIELHRVNPAYTSVIGKIKYATVKGWSVHAAAAGVIARRAQGFVEKAPASVKISLGPAVKTLSIPVRNAKEGPKAGRWAEYKKRLRETLLKEVRLQSKADRLRFKNRQHCSP